VTASIGPTDRNVIPRWRSVRGTLIAGELAPRAEPLPPTPDQLVLLRERRSEWEDHGTETFAVEFVGTATLLGLSESAGEAREFLDAHATTPSSARFALGFKDEWGESPDEPPPLTSNIHYQQRARIRALRPKLIRDPRNAIAWSELARAYAPLGQIDKAREACLVALQLSPTSRYLLRSAACFFASIAEPDRAYSLLSEASNTRDDPWLLAAEMAAANASGIRPSRVKRARLLVENENFSQRDISELASELATLEMSSNSKRARRLFDIALADPTENSLAQVEWASHSISGLLVPEPNLSNPIAAEARARHAQEEGNWQAAADNAELWQSDQLFSAEAAMAASYASAVGLDDWDASIQQALIGLVAHPLHAGLLNNAGFALIQSGRLKEAASLLAEIDLKTVPDHTFISATATRGLFAFRSGNIQVGRQYYEAAVDTARAKRLVTMEVMALLMLAGEELLLEPQRGIQVLTRAERVAKGTQNKAVERRLAIVRQQASAMAGKSGETTRPLHD